MTMITGAHCILYSSDPDADRALLKDVLELPHVDVGNGWLVFGLPPSEVAVHPAASSGKHELFLLVDDVETFAEKMREKGVSCSESKDEGWGVLTQITLPGGGVLGVYEPRHARPEPLCAEVEL